MALRRRHVRFPFPRSDAALAAHLAQLMARGAYRPVVGLGTGTGTRKLMAAPAVGEAAPRAPWAAGMAVRLHALIVRTPDPERLAAFWDGLLGASHVPFLLAYEESVEPKTGLNQIHVHLTSNCAAQDATVTDPLALGAIHLDVGQLPDEDHVVLADPDGNEFWIRG